MIMVAVENITPLVFALLLKFGLDWTILMFSRFTCERYILFFKYAKLTIHSPGGPKSKSEWGWGVKRTEKAADGNLARQWFSLHLLLFRVRESGLWLGRVEFTLFVALSPDLLRFMEVTSFTHEKRTYNTSTFI